MSDYDDETQDEPEVETYYPNVYMWVEHWLLPHWKRDVTQARWDPRWWEYTEVVTLRRSRPLSLDASRHIQSRRWGLATRDLGPGSRPIRCQQVS